MTLRRFERVFPRGVEVVAALECGHEITLDAANRRRFRKRGRWRGGLANGEWVEPRLLCAECEREVAP